MAHIIDLKFQGLDHVIGCFIVDTTEGPVLIETGPFSTYDNLKKGLESLGLNVKDIKHVLLTHIHFDHAGAAWAFAEQNAKIYVHPTGLPHMIEPEKLIRSATRIYGSQMDTLWGQLKPINESALIDMGHGSAVTIGDKSFIAWHTPGHASHHIAWQLDNMLFTGDAAGIKIKKGIVHPPCPPPDIDLEAWFASILLMESLPVNQLILTHYGIIEDLGSHWKSLKATLKDWSEWMKPYALNRSTIEEITPLFQTYVSDQLRKARLSEEDIRRYEAANPSWMSVSGLVRYWSKKQ
mgnify:CR=1 FL=1